MKRVVITFLNEEVFRQAEQDLLNEAREKYAANVDDVQDVLDIEEDDEEIRVLIKKIED